jgi:hypothetical protein
MGMMQSAMGPIDFTCLGIGLCKVSLEYHNMSVINLLI